MPDEEQNFELISVYTRADALADGNLVDVTETAREAGTEGLAPPPEGGGFARVD
jgi:hypothetical protein